MRRVVAAEYVSVDGCMEMGDREAKEDERGGWTAPYWNDELAQMQSGLLFASDALLLGRITYEGFAAAWPSLTEEGEFANRMNSLPKYVASRTLDEPLEWNATLLQEDTVAAVRELKQHPGQDLLVYGSGELLRTLLSHQLVDLLRLMIHPVLLGRGKRLLEGIDAVGLTVAASHVTEKGVVTLDYAPAAG
jgi:dihydrofolate reductase